MEAIFTNDLIRPANVQFSAAMRWLQKPKIHTYLENERFKKMSGWNNKMQPAGQLLVCNKMKNGPNFLQKFLSTKHGEALKLIRLIPNIQMKLDIQVQLKILHVCIFTLLVKNLLKEPSLFFCGYR